MHCTRTFAFALPALLLLATLSCASSKGQAEPAASSSDDSAAATDPATADDSADGDQPTSDDGAATDEAAGDEAEGAAEEATSAEPSADVTSDIPCQSNDDCWASSGDSPKPIARPKKLRGRQFKVCKDGEGSPVCLGNRCGLVFAGC